MPSKHEEEQPSGTAVRERKRYAGGHISAVLPGPLDDEITKSKLFDKATASAARNGLYDHPYFGTARRGRHPEKFFRGYIERRWGGPTGIVVVMAEDLGVSLDTGHGLRGVRRAGSIGARKTAEWRLKCIGGTANVHNLLTDAANNLFGLDGALANLRLLPPAKS